MPEPLVVAIMLTKDRPQMAARAVRCFREQTYQNRLLVILDTSDRERAHMMFCRSDGSEIETIFTGVLEGKSIGHLRNQCASLIGTHFPKCDIFIHWDDDDVSHPNRIAEQVAHLQASGADVVGYSELLFWNSTKCQIEVDPSRKGPDGTGVLGTVKSVGEAWLYRSMTANSAPGTSLCYWCKTWDRKPFPDLPKNNQSSGEDVEWLKGLNVATISGIPPAAGCEQQPRLIASIHGGNTMSYDIEAQIARGAERSWRRAPEWDEFCRGRMAL
jgi:hypothetical protein